MQDSYYQDTAIYIDSWYKEDQEKKAKEVKRNGKK